MNTLAYFATPLRKIVLKAVAYFILPPGAKKNIFRHPSSLLYSSRVMNTLAYFISQLRKIVLKALAYFILPPAAKKIIFRHL